MKTHEDVEKRLRKLLARYRDKYVHARIERAYQNCVHNYEHLPAPLPYSISDSRRPETGMIAARRELPVFKESSIHICMYGSQKGEWGGDICDDLDARAPTCPWFERRTSEQEAISQFDDLMANVRYVFDNYKDVAALQWVLDIRDPSDLQEDPEPPLPVWKRFVRWFADLLAGPPPPVRELPAGESDDPVTEPNPEIPKGLWDADSQDPPA